MRLLTRASVRHLSKHRAQALLSILGVALGVAVVLSIDLAIQSARTAFRISAESVAGRATHVVVRDEGWIDEAYVALLRVDLGMRAAAPIVEGFAQSALLPGRALRVLGIDPFSEGPFRPYVVGGASGLDVSAFLTTRRGVVVSAATAALARVGPGDSLPVLIGGQAWQLAVVGVLDPADRLARTGLADVLLMDVAGAQEVLRTPGRLSRIDLRIEEGEEGRRMLDAVRAALPPDTRIEPAGTRSEAMSGMIAAFDVNLTALSLLALIFGMFLIYNSVTFSVVQRRTLLGRLRTLGVTRAEIVRIILVEALWLGVVGAILGTAAGVALAQGLVRMVTRTINDLYFSVSVESVSLEPILFAKAAALGVGATLIAALPPALEAASSSPRLALMRSVAESRARRAVPMAALVGAGLSAFGGLLLLIPTRSLGVSFSALFFIITGLALATPAATLLMVAGARPLLRRTAGTLGVMAARGITNSSSRTAPAIAALVVAVSVTVGLGVMIQSFRGTLVQWLDGTLQADIYVSLPGSGASRAVGTMWPGLIEDFVRHPEVVGHTTYRGIGIVRESDAFRLVALDLDPRGERAFSFVEGRAASVMTAFQAAEGVIVSEPFAYRRGLSVGDDVDFDTDSGPESFSILGVFYDYGSEQGVVMMSRHLYDRYFSDPTVTSLGLFLSEGADSEAVVRDLLRLVPEGRTVVVRTNDTLRTASLEIFDRTFEVTAVLRALAFIVAFVGVLSALMALELERAREIAILRATGLTPWQVWRLVVTETAVMGLAAGLLAIPMGLTLSVVMIFVVNKRSFGWSLNMIVAPGVLVQAVALALVGALLAGIYPAWRMARTPPAAALRGE